jgi:hypothetical protein
MLTKTSFVVVFGDNLRGHPLESDIPRAFAARDMHLLSSTSHRLDRITHQPPKPPSRSTWILETLTPQSRKINAIFVIFRAFSIIWIFFWNFLKTLKNRENFGGVGVGGKGVLGGWWVLLRLQTSSHQTKSCCENGRVTCICIDSIVFDLCLRACARLLKCS